MHVGIIMDNNQIIHASGKVRIDKLDEKGIFNVNKQKYSQVKIHKKNIEMNRLYFIILILALIFSHANE